MPTSQNPQDELRLAELIAALSLATDLAMGQPAEQTLRASVLAVRLGESLGLAEPALVDTYYLTLLRMVGCTADARLIAEVFGDEMEAHKWLSTIDTGRPAQVVQALFRNVGAGEPPLQRAGRLARAISVLPRFGAMPAAHCEVAQRLADRLGFGERLIGALDDVFERWDGRGGPYHLKGEEIALAARIAVFAQEMATFYGLGGIEASVAAARQRSGGAYDPNVVAHFTASAATMLADFDDASAWDLAIAAEPGDPALVSEPGIDGAVHAIADFADLKLPFMGGHSSGVADLAGRAAAQARLSTEEVTDIRRAGYLHEIGFVAIPADVLLKPGRLSEGEWERVRLHSYYTERILARPRALARLGAIAGLHHERVDGSGYHRGVSGPSLPPAARILVAADAFHAMLEPRPHRPALEPAQAAHELVRSAQDGHLDSEAVNAVLAAAEQPAHVPRPAWPSGLTEREVEVLRLAARGLTKRSMAKELIVAPSTVDHHVRHIYQKIGVSTRAAATLFAMQHGLLEVMWAPLSRTTK